MIKMKNKLIIFGLAALLAGILPKNAKSENYIGIGFGYNPSDFSVIKKYKNDDENTFWKNQVGNEWVDFTYPACASQNIAMLEYRNDRVNHLDSLKVRLKSSSQMNSVEPYDKTYNNTANGSSEIHIIRTEKLDASAHSLEVIAEKNLKRICNVGIGIGVYYNFFNYSLDDQTSETAGMYRIMTNDRINSSTSSGDLYLSASLSKKFLRRFYADFSVSYLASGSKNLTCIINQTTEEDFNINDGIPATVKNETIPAESVISAAYPRLRLGVSLTCEFSGIEIENPFRKKSRLDALIEKDDLDGVRKYEKKHSLSRKEKMKVEDYLREKWGQRENDYRKTE